MRILVISSCSDTQKHNPPNKLLRVDFSSSDRLAQRTEELSQYKELAAEMYKGPNHVHLMEGLSSIRAHDQYGKTTVDLYIISTGYGMISEHNIIVPYDVKPKDAIWKQTPYCVCEKVLGIIHDYDLVLFLLGQDLEALQIREQSFEYSGATTLIFLIAPTHSKKFIPSHLPPLSNISVVNTGKALAKDIPKGSPRTVGGIVFKKLCEMVCSQGFNVFEDVKKNPWLIPDIARNQ